MIPPNTACLEFDDITGKRNRKKQHFSMKCTPLCEENSEICDKVELLFKKSVRNSIEKNQFKKVYLKIED